MICHTVKCDVYKQIRGRQSRPPDLLAKSALVRPTSAGLHRTVRGVAHEELFGHAWSVSRLSGTNSVRLYAGWE